LTARRHRLRLVVFVVGGVVRLGSDLTAMMRPGERATDEGMPEAPQPAAEALQNRGRRWHRQRLVRATSRRPTRYRRR
jgi:hypothetical protein